MKNLSFWNVHARILWLLPLSIAACGPGLSNFEGTWKTNSGTITTACPGQPDSIVQDTGDETLAASASGSGVVETNADGCNINFTVSGDTATVVPGQTCNFTQNGTTIVASIQSDSFTTSDGQNATEAISGSAVVSSGGQSTTCTVTGTASLTKVSK